MAIFCKTHYQLVSEPGISDADDDDDDDADDDDDDVDDLLALWRLMCLKRIKVCLKEKVIIPLDHTENDGQIPNKLTKERMVHHIPL